MDYILDNLAIGNAREAQSPPSSIDALLCVAWEIDAVAPGVSFHKVPIIDMQPIPPEQLHDAVRWIHAHIGKNRILVFCNAGVGRSSSVVVAYLCGFCDFGFGAAVEFVARKRPYMSILPNLVLSIDEMKTALQTRRPS